MLQPFKSFLTAAVLATFAFGCAESPPAVDTVADATLAIEHVTVIDVATGERLADQTVLVRGDQIVHRGPAAEVAAPTGVRVFDGRGRFLIPGIWDMHVHALRNPERILPLAVAHGITGVRDMGAHIARAEETRQAVANGLVSPRLILAGEGLEGVPGQRFDNPPNTVLSTPEEGRAMVRRLAEAKVDFLKAHVGLKRDVYDAIMDEARKVGLPVDGHLQPGMDAIQAADAGQRTIEHVGALAGTCAADPAAVRSDDPNAPPIQLDQAKCEMTMRHLAQKGTWITPTLGAPGSANARARNLDLAITRMAFQSGVRLLAGTDFHGGGLRVNNYEGTDRNVMDELAALVEAGLTPLEALRTATVNPAILLGMENRLGSVETGKLADLLLLDGDPLVDIANMKRMAGIVVNGRLFDAAEMQKMVDDEMAARARQAKQ